MDAERALILLLVVRDLERDLARASALGVLDDSAVLLAGAGLLADAAPGHDIVELDIDVDVERDLELHHGEALLAVRELRGLALALAHISDDALGLKGALVEVVALVKDVRAIELLEDEILILVESTRRQIHPIEAILLVDGALIVAGLRNREGNGGSVPCLQELL